MAPPFGDAVGRTFKHGFLTKQSALWAAIGVNINLGQRFSPVQQARARLRRCALLAARAGCADCADRAYALLPPSPRQLPPPTPAL